MTRRLQNPHADMQSEMSQVDCFRKEIVRILTGCENGSADVQRLMDSYYTQFGKSFPAPEDFGCDSERELFLLLRDVCSLEVTGNSLRVLLKSDIPNNLNDFDAASQPSNTRGKIRFMDTITQYSLAQQHVIARNALTNILLNKGIPESDILRYEVRKLSLLDACRLIDTNSNGGSLDSFTCKLESRKVASVSSSRSIICIDSSDEEGNRSAAQCKQNEKRPSSFEIQSKEFSETLEVDNHTACTSLASSVGTSVKRMDGPCVPAAPASHPFAEAAREAMCSSSSKNFILPRVVGNLHELDNACRIVVENLSANHEVVLTPKVEKYILNFYKKQDFTKFRITGVMRSCDVPTLREIDRKSRRIALYVQFFVRTRSVCTIHELDMLLTSLEGGEGSFESLQLGPLWKQPAVFEQFKFPVDGSALPPAIDPYDLCCAFRDYLSKENLWGSQCLSLSDFLLYLTRRFGKQSPWELGVKIVSLPLMKQIIGRVQSDCRRRQDELHRRMLRDVISDIEREVCLMREEMVKKISSSSQSSLVSDLQYKVKTTPVLTLLQNCFRACWPLFRVSSTKSPSQKAAAKKCEEVCRAFENFFQNCKAHPVAAALFEFCIIKCDNLVDVERLKEAIVFMLDNLCLWDEITSFHPASDPPHIAADTQRRRRRTSSHTAPPPPPPAPSQIQHDEEEDDDDDDITCLEGGADGATGLPSADEAQLATASNLALQLLDEASCCSRQSSQQLSWEQLSAIECRVRSSSASSSDKLPPAVSLVSLASRNDEVAKRLRNAVAVTSSSRRNIRTATEILDHDQIVLFLSECDSQDEHTKLAALSNFCLCPVESLEVELDTRWNRAATSSSLVSFADAISASVDISTCLVTDLASIVLARLEDLDYMCDVTRALDWNHLFLHRLGSFSSFVCKIQLPPHSTDYRLLRVGLDEFTKIAATATHEQLREAADRNLPRLFTSLLVSLIVSAGGLAQLPVKLMQAQLHAPFAALSAQGLLAQFVLRSLVLLPKRLALGLTQSLFLAIMGNMRGGGGGAGGHLTISDPHLSLVAACSSYSDRLRLGSLGCSLGIRTWAQFLVPNSSAVPNVQFDAAAASPISYLKKDSPQNLLEPHKDETSCAVASLDAAGTVERREAAGFPEQQIKISFESDACADYPPKQSPSPPAPPVGDEDVNEMECRVVVEQILREEFGEGLELGAEARSLLAKHQGKIGRSLERLSKELYSQDLHFVLELIQNADDNAYDGPGPPSLAFCVEQDRLVVLNNERGFRQADIAALCDVGKTTKGKHRKGFIGQKGIGFKSVFRVTDRPEIHSRGYHIKFDVTHGDGGLGLIKPVWIGDGGGGGGGEGEERGRLPNCVTSLAPGMGTTRIVLPFTRKYSRECLMAKLAEIEPSVLLFLNKLQCIATYDALSRTAKVLKKRLLPHNVVCITHGDVEQHWLVVTSTIPIPDYLDIPQSHTDLSFAFPLLHHTVQGDIDGGGGDGCHFSFLTTRTFDAFAFLPVRDFGLRFIVQADFEIPSSRQDIDCDSVFNQWLATHIPAAFINCFDTFNQLLSGRPQDAAIAFINYLPLPTESFGFFKPIATRMCELARHYPLIPCDDGTNKLPSRVVRVPPAEHFPLQSELLTAATGLSVADSRLNGLSAGLLKLLDVDVLDAAKLLTVLRFICFSADTDRPLSNEEGSRRRRLNHTLHVLSLLETSFSHQLNGEMMEALAEIPFILLASGEWTSVTAASSGELFMCEDEECLEAAGGGGQLALLKLVHPTMTTRTGSAAAVAAASAPSPVGVSIARLLEKIGVRLANRSQLLIHHVIPTLKDRVSDLDDCQLVKYTLFAITAAGSACIGGSHNGGGPCIDSLLDNLTVLAEERTGSAEAAACSVSRRVSPAHSVVYFSAPYQPALDLPTMFSATVFTCLSSAYADAAAAAAAAAASPTGSGAVDLRLLREFFSRAGVCEWFGFSQLAVEDGSVTDYQSELVDVLSSGQGQHPASMRQLVPLLSAHWPNMVKYLNAKRMDPVEGGGGGGTQQLIPSRVAHALQTAHWVSCVSSGGDSAAAAAAAAHLQPPSHVFINTTETFTLLRENVYYLHPSIDSAALRPEFLQFIRMQTHVQPDHLLDMLVSWAADPHFHSSLQHLANVYSFLQNSINPDKLRQTFAEKNLLFLPRAEFGNQFCASQELVLDDRESFFKKYRALTNKFPSLAPRVVFLADVEEYKLLGGFFHAVGALAEPSAAMYRQLLLLVTKATDVFSLGGDGTVGDVFQLVALALPALSAADKVIPCSGNRLASVTDAPLVLSDSPHLWKLLASKPELFILHPKYASLPCEVKATLQSALHLSLLSELVTQELVTEQIWTCSSVHKFMHFVCPYLQMYMWLNYPELYSRTCQTIAGNLLSLKFFTVKTVELVFRVRGLPDLSATVTRSIFCNGREFYLSRDFIGNWRAIGKEIASYISGGDAGCELNLSLFIDALVRFYRREEASEDIADFLHRFGIRPVPASHTPWIVSEPIYSDANLQLEIRRNEEEEAEKTDESDKKPDNSHRKPSPGQWPPRGAALHKPENPRRVESTLLPPPPKAPADWHVTKLLSLRENPLPNRVPGDADAPTRARSESPPANDVADSADASNVTANELVLNRGEKRLSEELDPRLEEPREKRRAVHLSAVAGVEWDYGGPSIADAGAAALMSVAPAAVTCQMEKMELEGEGVLPELPSPPPAGLEVTPLAGGVELERSAAVGRFGEQLVFNTLKRNCDGGGGSGHATVEWLNEDREQLKPYDIRVTRADGATDYIEVKSTSLSSKQFFQMSPEELIFAHSCGPNYFLFLVFNALTPNAEIRYFSNLHNKLRTKQVSLFFSLNQ